VTKRVRKAGLARREEFSRAALILGKAEVAAAALDIEVAHPGV
jgi:hypothetical protein